MTAYRIIEDDLTGAEVLSLLTMHLEEVHRLSAGKDNALPIERLREPDVTFYSAWDGERLAAVGALREFAPGRAEIKSMRAAPEYRGKGAGEAILLHLIDEARRRGHAWLGLETGRYEGWSAARNLYRKHGFAPCEEFGDYVADEFSMCMSRDL